MDAAEITRLLDKAHPDGVTWETHLAFVERLASWAPDRILDFQDSLFAHVVDGSWTVSRGGAVQLPSGSTVPAPSIAAHLASLEALVEQLRRRDASVETLDSWEADIEVLRAVGQPAVVRTEVPPGYVGVPVLDPFVEELAKLQIARGGRPSRRRVLALANDESWANAIDLVRVLRAAAAALEQTTGALPPGFLPLCAEERHRSGEMRLFRVVHVLERASDRIETVYVTAAPSAGYLSARLPSIAPVARALGARVVGKSQFTDLGPLETDRVPSEAVIDEWATRSDALNGLLEDARLLLSGDARRHAADRGGDGPILVRSRAMTPDGEVDTVRRWMVADPGAAHRDQLALEAAQPARRDVRIIDDLRISRRLPFGLLVAPVNWVRAVS